MDDSKLKKETKEKTASNSEVKDDDDDGKEEKEANSSTDNNNDAANRQSHQSGNAISKGSTPNQRTKINQEDPHLPRQKVLPIFLYFTLPRKLQMLCWLNYLSRVIVIALVRRSI